MSCWPCRRWWWRCSSWPPGHRLPSLLLALTVTGWTPFARLARALAYDVSARGFVEAARVVGCPPSFIVFRHILPHLAGPMLGQATLRFGQFLISVGALSYLGLGVQPPQSDWGSMLAAAQPYAVRAPMAILAPGLVIFAVALCVTLIGQRAARMSSSPLLLPQSSTERPAMPERLVIENLHVSHRAAPDGTTAPPVRRRPHRGAGGVRGAGGRLGSGKTMTGHVRPGPAAARRCT